jgi:NAD(P)-dependent dehydrogenase (short-subunit alcohol dehydrogenase family)
MTMSRCHEPELRTMDLGLQGHIAVVTGASRGIGLAIVQALADEGAQVVAGSRRGSPELDALVATGNVRALNVDLADPAGPARLVEFAGDRVDILVNNVGNAPARTGGFLEVTDEQWQASLALNLMPAVRTTRSVLPLMLAAGRGAIVNISSVNATLPDPAVIDYSAAKAALANFSKSLSKEVGPHGIRVNMRPT